MTQEPLCEQFAQRLEVIDAMIARVDHFRVEPKFSKNLADRQEWNPNFDASDDHIFHRCVDLIAYSNNAKAEKVKPLLESGVFADIFQGYSIPLVVNLEPETIVLASWSRIRGIRFKYKIGRMVNCAKCLLVLGATKGSFMK